ncbi:hypothetical protein FH972_011771 [Carpinus fangiana]|uniref:Uncharacterized protein n=1 Tax=Carpinus fangiana TaxID=176857 RepID=A0A660KUF8_9ROSI|nr:hypothetical protein FH972_011771 [Carpinus fangiana]
MCIAFVADGANGSDSETNSDETQEHYQPISAVGYDDDEDSDRGRSDEDGHHGLANGAYYTRSEEVAENGIASLQILRAFREDESRRNAPLTPENATRVMEAMRGVSFGGVAPDWAGQVPEDQWIDRLRRLRQPPQRTSTSLQN